MATVVAFVAGVVVAAFITARWTARRPPVRLPDTSAELPDPDRGPLGSRWLAASLDALPVGVVVVDADGVEVVRNRAAQVGGVRHHHLLLEDALDTLLKQARATGEVAGRVLELQGPNPRVMSLAVHPLDDGGAISTLADITERARLDAVRTDFVANLSHELKTPVGALAVLAETLADVVGAPALDADDRAVAARLAHKLVTEAHRLSQSIDELLALSRIELEGADLRGQVTADAVVHEAVARVRPLSEPTDITVSLCLPDPPVTLFADERQLTSALGNLLENAVKYSDPGSTVEVGVRLVEPDVEFWVRDWGIGIPARDLDRIFERFYRVDRARSRNTGGTGLGLSIVRHVASNHGGGVSVTSHEGEGSTFVLRLPRTPNPPEEDR